MHSYQVRARKCSKQSTTVCLQKNPAWPSLCSRLLLSQFIIREAHREIKIRPLTAVRHFYKEPVLSLPPVYNNGKAC